MCINYNFLHLYLQFYYSRILKILKVCQVTLATPPYGVITHHLSDITRRGLSNKEKNGVSSFTRSKVTEGVPKFKKV